MRNHALIAFVFGVAACGGGGESTPPKTNLFPPKPECQGMPVTIYAGTNPQIISHLAIGMAADGFDLDGDGKPDNKLAAVSSIAQSAIDDSFANYEILIPMEFFDAPTTLDTDACVKFAIYLGAYDKDTDGDGKRPGIKGGDCNDNDPTIGPGMPEIAGDLKDNNCNGLADENTDGSPNTTETVDMDGDGMSVAQGDCDDTDKSIHPGAVEICNDGKDNDCDGVADYSVANPLACSPFDPANPIDLALDPLSLDPSGQPVITFKDGNFDNSSGALQLNAGPDLFGVNIPVTNGITLDLKITGATIKGDVVAMGDTWVIKNGHIGGVIDARTADTIRGLTVSQIGLTPDDSLLDAVFANLLGPLLALPTAPKDFPYKGCRSPDIDVDGDGLEFFCDSNPDDDTKVVDICVDGDGTEVRDTMNADGSVTQCTDAVDDQGNPRFVDGISVELNFETLPLKSIKPPVQ
ncbi:MAG TPA: putative metal-binding motif-containing protein [Kofleriaceae bacterium]|nr:putative metal-binding motif-containing protein [Kofleriaceae bacterium]